MTALTDKLALLQDQTDLARLVIAGKANEPVVELLPQLQATLDQARAATKSEFAASDGAAKVGFIQSGTGAVARTVQDELRRTVWVEQFGAVGDGVVNCTDAIWNAVRKLRGAPVTIDNGLGGGNVTAYPSGIAEFGYGTFVIDPDKLDFISELGLTFRGRGSRGANNSVRAATTLLIKGASSGFGIRASGNGARNLRIENMDICYADASFTGHLLDLYGVPGSKLDTVFLGTYGTTGGTRLQAAASLVRLTYDEFFHMQDCVLDGAVDGILCDNSRGIYEFGGSMMKLDNVTFYDFTGTMIKQDATRSRRGVQINNCTFNPISIAGARAIDLGNVQGLTINGGLAIGSVGHAPSVEWMRLLNCTGKVEGFCFGDYSKAATIGGYLKMNNNVVDTTDGFVPTFGVITGEGNRFRYGANGWNIGTPTSELTLDIGPDYFATDVTRSYNVTTTSGLVTGRINYAKDQDKSTSKFANAGAEVRFENIDRKTVSIADANYTIGIGDTGRTIRASASGTQLFIMPPPIPGASFRVTTGAFNFTLATSSGYPFFTGIGGTKTSIDKVAADVGAAIDCIARGTEGWEVKTTGNWTMV